MTILRCTRLPLLAALLVCAPALAAAQGTPRRLRTRGEVPAGPDPVARLRRSGRPAVDRQDGSLLVPEGRSVRQAVRRSWTPQR